MGLTCIESARELYSTREERLHLAQSLPKGWGWPLARGMNLVRK